MNLTQEEIVKEILKCRQDPLYFIKKYCKIPAPEGIIKVKLYPKQEEIIKSCLNDHYVIILGSRQTGKTTSIQLFTLWLVLFYPKYQVAITSRSSKAIVDFIREIMDIYHLLPDFLKFDKLVIDNVFEKVFPNGSIIRGVPVNPQNPENAGRGLKADFVIIDEAAFIKGIDKAFTALKPVTSRRHLRLKKAGLPYGIAIISTPNGMYGIGEWFYKMWVGALNGENGYKPIKFHWRDVPEYDEEWFREQTKDMSERDINQEYELVFYGSESAFFPDSIIEKLQREIGKHKPISELKLPRGYLKLYKPLDKNRLYLIGCDPADSGQDYAALVIIDYESDEVVGVFYSKEISVSEFTENVLYLAQYLENSLIIFENNGIGKMAAQVLYQANLAHRMYIPYEKRYRRDAYKHAGISTNRSTRRLMLDALYHYVVNNWNKIYDSMVLSQLAALEYKGDKVQAPSNMHDDLAMALAFTQYVKYYGKIEDYLTTLGIKKEEVLKNLEMLVEFNQDKVENTDNYQFENPILNILASDIQSKQEASSTFDKIFEEPVT